MTVPTAVLPFDLTAPLPHGRLRLEASAGTGKTYAVAALVTRFIVEEGVPVGALLVTTFTRAAAQELRDRIRARLAETAALLAHDTPQSTPPEDSLLAWLDDAAGAQRSLWRQRAQAALADIDAATIDTIHAACRRVLLLAGRQVALEEHPGHTDTLVAEVVNDLLVTEGLQRAVALPEKRLAALVRTLLANPLAQLVLPSAAVDGEGPSQEALDQLVQCASRAVAEVRARSRDRVSFDGLLQAAYDTVTRPDAAELCEQLARRFPVAIVDEAQDTDPLQWGIVDALYPADTAGRPSAWRALVVVGDPKQSIYSFRGADVAAFTRAGAGAQRRTLEVNYRSDQPLLDALNILMSDATFGEGIAYHPVQAPPKHQQSKLPGGEPVLELVLADCAPDSAEVAEELHGVAAEGGPHATVATAMADLALDPMAQVAAARVHRAMASGCHAPGHIAVLVGNRYEGERVARALRDRGVPCTTAGTASVMQGAAAAQVRTLLRALGRPADMNGVRLLAIGWFGTLDHAALATASDDLFLPLQEQLLDWRPRVRRLGVASLLRHLAALPAVIDRLAATGELPRHLTDLEHLAELLHDGTNRQGCTPDQALAALLVLQRMDEKNELVARRLETDAEVVQVMTTYAAKGLQFPMVVVAQHWRLEPSSSAPPMARLAAADAQRVVDGGWVLRSETPGVWDAAASALLDEQARLMYVAMTRAEHQLVVLLATEEPDDEAPAPSSTPGRVLGLSAPVTSVEGLRAQLEPRLAPLGGRVRVVDGGTVVEEAPRAATMDSAGAERAAAALATAALPVAPLPAPVRSARREWSFTAISSYAGSEGHPDQGGLDEHHARASDGDDDGDDTSAPGETPPGPLAHLPASAEVGVCLHAVLERADFTAPNPEAELRPLLARHAAVPSLAPHHDALATGLAQLLTTPLGTSVPGNVALAQLARRDRLDELRFRLALAPRDRTVHVKQLGQLWADALSPSDPLRAYAGTLARGALDAWPAGFLVGAIDLVTRLATPSGDGTSRYLVIDYKSNRLPDGYHHQAMRRAMMAHHYPLQGLLYCVAVHRYLRWRTGVADPSPQLAGFAYLFVRGMVGAHTPVDAHGRVHGVFHWEPPPGLVVAASALLAGDAAEVAA